MAKEKISEIRLEPAENGFVLRYCKMTKKEGKGSTYDNCNYEYPTEVFTAAEADKATARMLELAAMMTKD